MMSGGTAAHIILFKLKTILLTWSYHNINRNTHTLKCRNEGYQYYTISNCPQCGLNAWTHWAFARGSHEQRNLILIYAYMYVVYSIIFNV